MRFRKQISAKYESVRRENYANGICFFQVAQLRHLEKEERKAQFPCVPRCLSLQCVIQK